jgi:site-specific DNA recombinase
MAPTRQACENARERSEKMSLCRAMKRAAIYARYSTDNQSLRSIEDQVTLCRDYAAREGLHVVAVYDDPARSSGSIMGRPGVQELLRATQERRFDVIIVEALDRLSCDMEDLAHIYKNLNFAGVEIRGVHEGQVTTVLIGLRGLVGQLRLEDLKHKIRRGMSGRARQGLVQAGLAYGYRVVPGQPGARVIDEREAAVVRRIYEEYLEGATPRAIAGRLNAEGIPAPQGGCWNSSTLNGNGKRGVGILRNELYIGRVTWGRTRKVVSPTNGKQLIRPGIADSAASSEVPELAIISKELFEAVQQRKLAMSHVHPGLQRGRTHLLSGLLRCGACGAGMYVHATSKQGHRRIACSRHRESGDCPDPHTFMLPTIERAVLAGLKAELHTPAAITEFARAYQEERRRLVATAGSRRRELEREVDQNERRLARLIDCIANGYGDPAVLGPQSSVVHRKLEELRGKLLELEDVESEITLRPSALEKYREHVEHLAESLCSEGASRLSMETIRDLIETVTVWRGAVYRAVRVQIRGRLAALIGSADDLHPSEVWGAMERVMGIEPTS